jgi:hypothetical protein
MLSGRWPAPLALKKQFSTYGRPLCDPDSPLQCAPKVGLGSSLSHKRSEAQPI